MPSKSLVRPLSLAIALLAAGCGDGTAPVTPQSLAIAAGDAQTGPVATELPAALEVLVTGSDGKPMAGVVVTWASAAGGGALSATSTTTGTNGRAGVRLTLGQKAEPIQVSASSAGLAPVTFQATAVAGPPASIEVVSGADQTGTVGSALSQPVSVRVKDVYGNVVGATKVTFTADGGGSFNPADATTDAQGAAQSVWTLGRAAGDQTSSVSAGSTGAARAGVKAKATAAAAAAIEAVSGGDQIATAGTTLPAPLTVRVKDAYGNPVPAVAVSFTTADGGSLSPAQASTGAGGLASSSWRLGSPTRAQEATATVSGAGSAKFKGTGTYAGPGLLEGAYEYAGGYPEPQRRTFTLKGETVELIAFPGQLLTFLKPGTASTDAAALIKSAGGSVLACVPKTGFYFVGVPAGGEQAYINSVSASSTAVSVLPSSPEEERGGPARVRGLSAGAPPAAAASGVRVVVIDHCGGAGSHGTSVLASYFDEAGGGTGECLNTTGTPETILRLQEAAARHQGEKVLVNISLGPEIESGETFAQWQRRAAHHIEGILNALRVLEGAADNIGITYAAGNDGSPLQGVLAEVRKDPESAALLRKHMLIVGVKDAAWANHAKGDQVFAQMDTGDCVDGDEGTSCAAPRALAVLREVLDSVDVSVTDAVFAAQTSANSNASFELVHDEAISRAKIVKEASGDDRAAAESVSYISIPLTGATTTGVVTPAVAGVSISLTDSGTDGFFMYEVHRTDASGRVSFSVPPGEPGVVDTITLMVVLTGVKNRAIHTWTPAPPASGASTVSRRVRVP